MREPAVPLPGAREDLVLAVLTADPAATAIMTDFDGTLAPIVEDPAAARALPGAADLLVGLARRFALVGVVSGRPAALILRMLGGPQRAAAWGSRAAEARGVRVAGLYGLELADAATGAVEVHPEAARSAPAVEQAAAEAAAGAPAGVSIERKGLTVTLHWRQAPHHAGWAQDFARSRASALGLEVALGKMSSELRPPVPVDKGTVVLGWCSGLRAACFLGDDRGDLAAFEALDRLASAEGCAVAKIAVSTPETPPELLAAADLAVEGPEGALAFLARLAAPA